MSAYGKDFDFRMSQEIEGFYRNRQQFWRALNAARRWEYKFLRRALTGDEGLALVSLLRVSPNKFYRQGIQNAAELAALLQQGELVTFEYLQDILLNIFIVDIASDDLQLGF